MNSVFSNDQVLQIYGRLYEIGKSINEMVEIEELYDIACEFATDELNFEKALIFEHNDANGWFKIVKSKGYDAPHEKAIIRVINLLLSGTVIEYLRVSGKPIIHTSISPKKEVQALLKSLFFEEAYLELFGGDSEAPYGVIIVGNGLGDKSNCSRLVEDSILMLALGNFTVQFSNTINNIIFYKAWQSEKECLEENVVKRTLQVEEQKVDLEKQLQIVKEAEQKQFELTQEIESIHLQTQDSIEYASLIQKAILPHEHNFRQYFSDFFTLWEPKDIVGGDIYLFQQLRDDDECLLMVIDCTGHGVSGAFVTMLVKAIEAQVEAIIATDSSMEVSPAWILSYFNSMMKKLLKQESSESISNVGFDGGVVYFNKKTNTLKFASAGTPLFYMEEDKLKVIKGNRHSIGYRRSDINFEFREYTIEAKRGMSFYLTTDGYWDQNGGEQGFPMGKKKFQEIIQSNYEKPFALQEKTFRDTLTRYQGNYRKNDDITLMAFKI